jgi:aromatic-L-amino-acid decarboxylase
MAVSKTIEETLDPDDWDEARKLGHKILDDMFNNIRDSKKGTFQAVKDTERRGLTVPLTKEGEGEEKAYEDFYKYALPSLVGAKTARFWGFVAGGGSHYGVLADMIASEVN